MPSGPRRRLAPVALDMLPATNRVRYTPRPGDPPSRSYASARRLASRLVGALRNRSHHGAVRWSTCAELPPVTVNPNRLTSAWATVAIWKPRYQGKLHDPEFLPTTSNDSSINCLTGE